MAFESVRGYVQLASGLGELTRARALEAAQGLLALPGMAGATGKVAGQGGALAEEILAAAFANRENLTALVRGEVDVAVSRLGLVPAADLQGARDEVARLRAEVSRLREATLAGARDDTGAGTAAGGAGSTVAENTTDAGSPPPRRRGRASRGSQKAAPTKVNGPGAHPGGGARRPQGRP